MFRGGCAQRLLSLGFNGCDRLSIPSSVVQRTANPLRRPTTSTAGLSQNGRIGVVRGKDVTAGSSKRTKGGFFGASVVIARLQFARSSDIHAGCFSY